MDAKKIKIAKKTLFYIVLILLALVWITPIFTVFSTALKSKKDFFSGMSLFQIPEEICWENFVKAFTRGRLFMYMKNGLLICLVKVPLGILVESLAAFGITRLDLKHKTRWFIFFLFGMMLPMQVALVPLNVVYNRMGWINTYHGLLYAYIGFGISYGILIFRGTMRGIPRELDEAARIDGCNKIQLYKDIIMPVAKPAVATLVIMDFLSTWNEYLLASVIVNDTKMKTVPVGLMTFVGEHGTDYGLLCAGVLICVIPVMCVYMFFQRYFVEGISGAVKA